MYSCGNSRELRKARRMKRARFLPSCFIPARIFLMQGGNIDSLIVRFFMSIDFPVNFGFVRFFLFAQSSAWINSSRASPGSESGRKFFIWIFRGWAWLGLKFSIWSLSITADDRQVFSWRE